MPCTSLSMVALNVYIVKDQEGKLPVWFLKNLLEKWSCSSKTRHILPTTNLFKQTICAALTVEF